MMLNKEKDQWYDILVELLIDRWRNHNIVYKVPSKMAVWQMSFAM